ncbi:hypothetical protein BCR44DRAFT_1445218, partial [Catenaria anguillulae PL171]
TTSITTPPTPQPQPSELQCPRSAPPHSPPDPQHECLMKLTSLHDRHEWLHADSHLGRLRLAALVLVGIAGVDVLPHCIHGIQNPFAVQWVRHGRGHDFWAREHGKVARVGLSVRDAPEKRRGGCIARPVWPSGMGRAHWQD